MEELFGLEPLPRSDEPASTATAYRVSMKLSLLDGYFGGHGAASAGLCAAGVREHLREEGIQPVCVTEMRCSYLSPVKALKPALVTVKPLPISAITCARYFVVEISDERCQHLFVRCHVTAVVPES